VIVTRIVMHDTYDMIVTRIVTRIVMHDTYGMIVTSMIRLGVIRLGMYKCCMEMAQCLYYSFFF
jgi:hypothetical protein